MRAHASGWDAYAAKVASDGSLTWHTFLGGSGNDRGWAIAVDGRGNVYAGGYGDATWGSPLRAYTSGYDGFAARLASDGTLTWNTFLGGSGNDWGHALAVDGSGDVYVAGRSDATWGSPVRPFTSGGYDAFVAKLSFLDDLGSYNNGYFYWDTTGNGSWDKVAGGDTFRDFGMASIRDTATPVVGDWDGNGIDDLGLYNDGCFYLDTTGNGRWDHVAGGDTFRDFGMASIRDTATPVVGDWDGNGIDDLGLYNDGCFYLDTTGNGVWDHVAGGDTFRDFGINSIRSTGMPVIGDWDDDGTDDLGLYNNGCFYLDTTSNGVWDHVSGGDTFRDFGVDSIRSTGMPVIGDWNDNGTDDLGLYNNGSFYLDMTGNGSWDDVVGGDTFRDFGIDSIRDTATPVIGRWASASPLLAVGGLAMAADGAEKLTSDALAPIVDQAAAAWAASALDQAELQRLASVQVLIADLPGARLGEASGTTITLDVDAAGYGWFVDATPEANEEFEPQAPGGLLADASGPAAERMDLLTAVMHELGHVLGHGDLDDDLLSNDVMNGWLPAGVRRM